MKRKALEYNHFCSGLCGFLGAEFCGDKMPIYFRREGGGGSWILSMQSDVVGNLTTTKIDWLSLKEMVVIYQWSLKSDTLYVKYLMTLLCQTSKGNIFWCFYFSFCKIILEKLQSEVCLSGCDSSSVYVIHKFTKYKYPLLCRSLALSS